MPVLFWVTYVTSHQTLCAVQYEKGSDQWVHVFLTNKPISVWFFVPIITIHTAIMILSVCIQFNIQHQINNGVHVALKSINQSIFVLVLVETRPVLHSYYVLKLCHHKLCLILFFFVVNIGIEHYIRILAYCLEDSQLLIEVFWGTCASQWKFQCVIYCGDWSKLDTKLTKYLYRRLSFLQ